MTAQEYQMKKQQIARLKNVLKGRFMTQQALQCMRAILECEKYEHQQREIIANELRNSNE